MSVDKKKDVERILREYKDFQVTAMKAIDAASVEINATDTKAVVKNMISTFEEIKSVANQKAKELKRLDTTII